MPKYIIVKESGVTYNSLEAAIDACRSQVENGDSVSIAEVVRRFKAEVVVKEIPIK